MNTSLSFRLGAAISMVAALSLAACSSTTTTTSGTGQTDGGGTPGDDSGAGPADAGAEAAAPFTLTSTALEEGAMFKADNTCTGKDVSPDLAWGPGPDGTKSYAIVFNDQTLDFLHGVTYDIPATTLALPAEVDNAYEPTKAPGVKQTLSFRSNLYGYAGPCAPKPNTDVYEFVLYALDVETLPNMTKTTTRGAAEIEIKKHVLGSTKLTGKYKQP